ncbi:MAG: cell division protein FtsZ [Flavobacteriaceae bacterium]|nr:cell division protein FtsZ [Flavobacteriaceae bacterium]
MDENLDLGISFDLPKNQSNVIKAIGVGGGGSNAINHMYKQGIKGVDFVICNTDAQALNNSGVPNKIQLGVNLTEGLGAGANPEVGEKAALESSEDIMSMLNVNTKMVFITAGMGGGTGTGAAPVIAKMARDMNILTVGIVTTPFGFEGKIRNEQAQIGIEKLRDQVDSLIIINNNKLREVYGNLGFKAGFSKADEVLSTASKGIAEVITHHYTQNIDLKDAKTVLSNSGTAIMGAASSSGSNRAYDAISKALDSPLLNDNRISGAKNVLLLIVSGNEEITIDEIGEINDYIQEQAGYGANIIMGVGEDYELQDSISVTVIATGFDVDQQNEISNTEPEKIVHELGEDNLFSQIQVEENPLEKEVVDFEKSDIIEDKIVHILEDDNCEETPSDEISVDVEDLNSDEKIIHVLDEFEDEDTESFDLLENNIEEFNSSDENEEGLDIETPFDLSEDVLNIESPIVDVMDVDVIDPKEITNENIEIYHPEINENEDENSIEWSLFDSDDNKTIDDLNKKIEVMDIEVKDYTEVIPENNSVDDQEQIHENEDDILFEQTIEIESKLNSSDFEVETQTIEATIKNDKENESKDPMNTSISDFQKQRSKERRLRMKEFNYKFNKSKIDDIENEPAYKRKGIELEDKNYSSENNISRTTVGLDENDDMKIRKNNSFLHDNVD